MAIADVAPRDRLVRIDATRKLSAAHGHNAPAPRPASAHGGSGDVPRGARTPLAASPFTVRRAERLGASSDPSNPRAHHPPVRNYGCAAQAAGLELTILTQSRAHVGDRLSNAP